jgi:hypothetical protein
MCGLIASVRQDERINSLGTRVRELKPYADGYCDGEMAMLAKCIEAVGALGHVTDCMWLHDEGVPCPHEDSVAALRALQEQP